MRKVVININKSDILDTVALNSAYVSTDKEHTGERVETIETDNSILTRFWSEMCGNVTEKLRNFIFTGAVNLESMKLELELSNAYDESLTPSVINDLSAAMVAGVTARWFQFRFHDRYEEWDNRSAQLLDRAFSKLCHRKKPTR